MAQTTPPNDEPRRAAANAPGRDLDSLLEALKTDARAANAQHAAAQATPPQAEPAGDLTARRVQVLIRAFDVLHRQVSAIASQGETIHGIAEAQAQHTKAIGDLQRNIRYLRAIVIQQLQQASPAPDRTLPPLNIKLVVGHLVEQYQQAERDAAVLMQWAMLFIGIALGTAVAALIGAIQRVQLTSAVLGTLAAATFAVAIIFLSLSRSARSRADVARRTMDESTLMRTVATSPVSEPS